MATYDLTKGGANVPAAVNSGFVFRPFVEIDFQKTPYASGDVLKIFAVAPGIFIPRIAYEVVRTEGATLTIDVGDSASATAFASNVNANSAGRGVNVLTLTEGTPNTITFNGKFYSAADAIQLTLDHAASNALVRFWALMELYATT